MTPQGFGRRVALALSATTLLLLALIPVPALAFSQATSSPAGAGVSGFVGGTRGSRAVPLPTPLFLPDTKVQVPADRRIVQAPIRSSSPRVVRTATSATTGPLRYQGGSVLSSVKIYVVFWGTEWQATSQAPVIAYIDGFFTDLGGSPWARSLTQYCSGIATNQSSCAPGATFIQNPVAQYQSSIIDTTPVPPSPTQAAIGDRAAAAAAYYNYPSGSLFMVYTPSLKSQSGFGTDWCAYHTWVQAGSTNVPYGYMPYQTDAGGNCGANLVDGPLDGFSIVGGHEYAEAVTDPLLANTAGYSGWLDPTIANFSGEIGDKCDWSPPVRNVTMNGHVWPVQGLFSNQALAQGLSPCVFSTQGTVPGRPTGVKAVAGNGQAIVAWAAPTTDGSSPIVSYTVKCSPACNSFVVGASSLQTIVTGLPGDTPISFTVTAVNDVGAGQPSSPSSPIRFRGAAAQSIGAPAPSRSPAQQSTAPPTTGLRTVL